MVDSKFVIDLQGKQFIKFEGLLDEAHKKGLYSIETELVQIPSDANGTTAIVRAKTRFQNKENAELPVYFQGIGDASPKSVNSKIVPHIIRQAETRAVARALRFACNVGMCSVDELGESEVETPTTNNSEPDGDNFTNSKFDEFCSGCGEPVTPKVREFSIKKFGKCICFECQKKAK